jgi:hypothetical protein
MAAPPVAPFRVRYGAGPFERVRLAPGMTPAEVDRTVAGAVGLAVGSFFIRDAEGVSGFHAGLAGDWEAVLLPGQAPPGVDRGLVVADLVAAVRATVASELLQNLARLFPAAGSPLSESYASVGTDALAVLNGIPGSVSTFAEVDASAEECSPLASRDDLERMRACEKEADLVAAVTPLLRSARGFEEAGAGEAADPCARVLVNSEKVGWLDSLRAPLPAGQLKKPGIFVTWAPFWSGQDGAACGPVGRLAHRSLQLDGCAREFYEAKLGVGELTAAGLGQLLDYHSRVRGPVRGMLFNADAIWLCASYSGHPQRLVKARWAARGSRALVRRFFGEEPEPPPLVRLLRSVCHELAVAPCRVRVPGDRALATSAFLGAGGSARVFCVAKARVAEAGAPALEELRALKVSTSLSRGDLEHEIATLRAAANAGAPVVPPVDSSLRYFRNIDGGALGGGGFLLQHVCLRAKLDSQASCAAAFRALRKLHAAGFAHGDARVPNLVQHKRDFLWIDMRESAADSLAEALHNDAQTLAASALRCPLSPELHASVLVALNDVPAGGDAAYASVADAVWAALRPLAPTAASEELDE